MLVEGLICGRSSFTGEWLQFEGLCLSLHFPHNQLKLAGLSRNPGPGQGWLELALCPRH